MSIKIRQEFKIGETKIIGKYGIVTIIELLPNGRCVVQFEDGFTKEVSRNCFRKGILKNPHQPTVFGVGILGEGFNSRIDGEITLEYMHWKSMLSRCYDKVW